MSDRLKATKGASFKGSSLVKVDVRNAKSKSDFSRDFEKGAAASNVGGSSS